MPTPEVRSLICRPFDSDLVYALYNAKSSPDTIFHHFMPMIKIVLATEWKSAISAYEDELISAAMTKLYDLILNRAYDAMLVRRGVEGVYGLNEFMRWHYYEIHGSMRTTVCDDRSWDEQRLTKYGIEPASMLKPWHCETRIYLSQLPHELENLVMERVRFEGNGYLACQYVLRCILRNGRVVEGVIKHELKLVNVKFFVDYVLVLLRSVLYGLRGGVPVGIIREYSYRDRESIEVS